MHKAIKILLVEDEVINAMLLREDISTMGYVIMHHVTTGENAVLYCKEYIPDIVLMDIRLAGKMDGIEAASLIKAQCKAQIIFISCYTDKMVMEKAQALMPLGFLAKPHDVTELKKLIDNCYYQLCGSR